MEISVTHSAWHQTRVHCMCVQLNEEAVWFVATNYLNALNVMRHKSTVTRAYIRQ